MNELPPAITLRTSKRNGFTLVELLTVIAIIGVLIAILLPAVQAAREAARRMTCKNHLKQIALGFLTHEEQHGFFPMGGWGAVWVPDPDRGFGKRQPGGWGYNVLPFIEQLALHDLGNGTTGEEKLRLNKQRIETPVELYYCPSRRPARAYPLNLDASESVYIKDPLHTETLVAAGRSDYAANGGAITPEIEPDMHFHILDSGPNTLAEGDSRAYRTRLRDSGGVVMTRRQLRLADVSDGASQTYLLGEKFMEVRWYEDQPQTDSWMSTGDEIGPFWGAGHFGTIARFAWRESRSPRQDMESGHIFTLSFGSAHAGGFHMSFCNGSVRTISYNIDDEMHRRLANREDGLPIDYSLVE